AELRELGGRLEQPLSAFHVRVFPGGVVVERLPSFVRDVRVRVADAMRPEVAVGGSSAFAGLDRHPSIASDVAYIKVTALAKVLEPGAPCPSITGGAGRGPFATDEANRPRRSGTLPKSRPPVEPRAPGAAAGTVGERRTRR